MNHSNERAFFLTRFGRGFAYVGRGVRLLAATRSLWPFALLPWLINGLTFLLLSAFLFAATGDWVAGLDQWMQSSAAGDAWWTYLLVPLLWLTTKLVWLLWALATVLVASLLSFVVIGNLVSGPFNDALSLHVERLLDCSTAGGDESLLGSIWRTLRGELEKSLFFGAAALIFWLLALVPGLNVVALPLFQLFTVLFVGLAFTDYAMDRRGFLFRHKRAFVLDHKATMLGFGLAVFLVMMLPLLNVVLLPALVVAGTMLFVEVEGAAAAGPAPDREAKGD